AYDFEAGSWDAAKEFAAQIAFLHSIEGDLGAPYRAIITRKLAANHFELSCAHAAVGNRSLARRHLIESWRLGWGGEVIPWHRLAEGLLAQASPRIHRVLRAMYDSRKSPGLSAG